MKKVTDEEIYLIDPEDTELPKVDLHDFVCGYDSGLTPFNMAHLLWLLLPIVGTIIIVVIWITYLVEKHATTKVFFYKDGIYITKQHLAASEEHHTIYYKDVHGMAVPRTQEFSSDTGYNGTTFKVFCLMNDGNYRTIFKGAYDNQKEIEDEYNMKGYVMKTMLRQWYPIAMQRHEEEIREKGKTTFYCFHTTLFSSNTGELTEVEMTPTYIRQGDDTFYFTQSDYAIEDDIMKLNTDDKRNRFRIVTKNMYDVEVFQTMVNKYLKS